MVGLFLRFRFRKKALDCSLLVTFLMVIDVDAITFEASNEWGGGGQGGPPLEDGRRCGVSTTTPWRSSLLFFVVVVSFTDHKMGLKRRTAL